MYICLLLKLTRHAQPKYIVESYSMLLNREATGRHFTLIELLVVITIILILASMLIPALENARMKALVSSCRANMKQISTAQSMYVEDADDYFVPLKSGDLGWADLLFQNLGHSLETLSCPVDDDYPTFKPGTNPQRLWRNKHYEKAPKDAEYCYGINSWNQPGARGPAGKKLTGVKRPMDVLLFMDGSGASPEAIATGKYPTRKEVNGQVDRLRHESATRFVVAFCDGHVEFPNVWETLEQGGKGKGDIMWNGER